MKLIIFKAKFSNHYFHFVHYMQYIFFCIDIILNDELNNTNFKYIIIEPKSKSTSEYCNSACKHILQKCSNVIFTEEFEECNIYKEYKYMWSTNKKSQFMLNNKIILGTHMTWFPCSNSEKMRNLFLPNGIVPLNSSKKNLKIGLVNRKKTRHLINYEELCTKIESVFNTKVVVTYFEDKSFDYQINFFNKHNIIISPHGAQLCSIPFSQDDSLIIECVHEEWHPYYYFPGLSNTSNKYHAMICDNHSVFPEWQGIKYKNTKQKKLNMNVNIQKVIHTIDLYIKNKLEKHCCYLI